MKLIITCFSAAVLGLLVPGTARAIDEREEVLRSAQILNRLESIPERGIPQEILRNARGLAILRVYKVGLGISGRGGKGVVVSRTPRGGWSGPAFIRTGGAGYGPQVGAKVTDFVLVLNTQQAVDAFARGGNITLGGALSAAIGPVGRTAEIDIAPIAAVYTYSQSRGLFIGASLEGTVLTASPNSNTAFYGRPVSPHAILNGSVRPPQAAAPLLGALPSRGRGAKGYAMR